MNITESEICIECIDLSRVVQIEGDAKWSEYSSYVEEAGFSLQNMPEIYLVAQYCKRRNGNWHTNISYSAAGLNEYFELNRCHADYNLDYYPKQLSYESIVRQIDWAKLSAAYGSAEAIRAAVSRKTMTTEKRLNVYRTYETTIRLEHATRIGLEIDTSVIDAAGLTLNEIPDISICGILHKEEQRQYFTIFYWLVNDLQHYAMFTGTREFVIEAGQSYDNAFVGMIPKIIATEVNWKQLARLYGDEFVPRDNLPDPHSRVFSRMFHRRSQYIEEATVSLTDLIQGGVKLDYDAIAAGYSDISEVPQIRVVGYITGQYDGPYQIDYVCSIEGRDTFKRFFSVSDSGRSVSHRADELFNKYLTTACRNLDWAFLRDQMV